MAGELYIGGDSLGRGYLNMPDTTAATFVPNPFSSDAGRRLYKTGDMARYLPAGDVEFLGRFDAQVKIRGFRVELEEIEAALTRHPGVQDAVVLVRRLNNEDQRLIAYLVPTHAYRCAFKNLKQYRLPINLTVANLNKNETDYLFREIFELQAYLKHGITIEEGDCIFDVGANIGLFTLFVNQISGNLEIYSFEPNPMAFEALSANSLIYAPNAKLFDFGLSNEAKTEVFTSFPGFSILSGFYADAAIEKEVVKTFVINQQREGMVDAKNLAEQVELILEDRFTPTAHSVNVRALSGVMEEYGIERIDLLKINVEKSELDVLKGIEPEDWKKIKQIVLEVDTEENLASIELLLADHGYHFVAEQPANLEETSLTYIYAIHPSSGRLLTREQDDGAHIRRLQDVVDLSLSPNGLRHFAGKKLPSYMTPSDFIILDALPLTANGKIDRQALLALAETEPNTPEPFMVPRDTVELELVQIWEELLQRRPVGVTDNFFELGGHSLLALRLVAQVRKRFAHELHLSSFFKGASIENLAAMIRQQSAGLTFSPLVHIQPLGSRRPFFCVHTGGGTVFCYYDLARCLSQEQPFYALQAAGLDGEKEPLTEVEEMASSYVEALRTVQPEGPYLLGGWSYGGVVAFEMAQQLVRQGQRVDVLAIFDSEAMGHDRRPEEWREMDDAQLLVEIFAETLPLSLDHLRVLGADEQLNYVVEMAKKFKLIPPDFGLTQARRLLMVYKANNEALMKYIPQAYPGRVTLFRPYLGPSDNEEDAARGWDRVAATGVDVHWVTGNHLNIMNRPHVEIIAEQLTRRLEQAQ